MKEVGHTGALEYAAINFPALLVYESDKLGQESDKLFPVRVIH